MKIIQDTREQKPWHFEFYGAEQISQKLDTGDYSFIGGEQFLVIDRKADVLELYHNFFTDDYKRFKKELLRMGSILEKYIICEFPIQDIVDFPSSARVKKNFKFGSNDLLYRVDYTTNKYGVNFLFCNNVAEAEKQAFDIIKRCYEEH